LGIYKCHAACLWALFLAIILAAVPRSWEVEIAAEAASAASAAALLPPPPVSIEGTFERNETLSTTLVSHDISQGVAHSVAEAVSDVFNVRSFRPGRSYRLLIEPSGELLRFEYSIDEESVLKVSRIDERFDATVEELPLETRTETISTDVRNSLWGALEGFPRGDWLVMELAAIFEAQVDFYKDIRSGDAIRLIVDAKYHDGQFVKYGSVLAAEFVNRGKPMQAYRFREEYFDETGMSARRSLLPSPLQFTRISSGFTYNRLHPIYKTVRPHLGVDYAAPTGTPVWAVGNGTVTFAGTNGGFGRMVTIRHPNGMTTSYAHLSSIGVRVGQRVSQKETIGRVGMTGTATGPHLDYRMTVNGKVVDPRTVRADPPKPIAPELKDEYLASIEELRLQLESLALRSERILSRTE
jgi:murein DD-endopeptidase MepM/ murein hydrolase activator NlpD